MTPAAPVAAGPVRIEPKFVHRVWGSHNLAPWFGTQAEKIGEVWFEAGEILIKFIFTTEPLSVQVHPGDAYAARHHGGSRGKTEMWHILRAEPGARIAAGFREPVAADAAHRGALDGSIETMLAWHDAAPGDTFFTPAGTVHAIGAGLALCEIQQNSDITYRLYDWGRKPARELHLEHGFAVADLGPASSRTAAADGVLAACPYFTTEAEMVAGELVWPRDSVMIVLSGNGSVAEIQCALGQVWRVPAGAQVSSAEGMQVLRTYVA
ncbi:MAG: class I mannose-6-phosphate isomerase [Bryobacteraceae bacterium]